MTKEEAIKTLKTYSDWRRGAEIPQPCPKQIGAAIDLAIEILKRMKS